MTAPGGKAGWDSLLVELHRFGDDTAGHDTEKPYLRARGTERVRKFETGLSDDEFRQHMRPLRYVRPEDSEEDREAARAAALDRLVAVATAILPLELPDRRQQIDLVINAKELAALPFEAARGPDGRPLLVGRKPAVELTRRVRGAFREHVALWPAKPNVLLVASSPARPIPLEEHKTALRRTLKPWIEPLEGFPDVAPDERDVLTIVEEATLSRVTEACRDAKAAFTHVHVLAHGCEVRHGQDEQFGLELADEETGSAAGVSAEDFLAALKAGGTLPTVVTVTACDSANVGSRISSAPSVAHALHMAGVPVVLASQFPLTVEGSKLVVEEFYGSLFTGADVRDAIHRTRQVLHDREQETEHDWMSLVAYVQLPEGYVDRLLEVRLQAELASLKTAQVWADHLVKHSAHARAYDDVADRIQGRIESLERWASVSKELGRRHVLGENRGLLGSAHKRKAELYFCRARVDKHKEVWLERSREALEKAHEWYVAAFTDDLSDHWTGVQQLSLEAVLRGRIEERWRWHAAMQAARRACEEPKTAVWGWGSRAELHLLAPRAGMPEQVAEAQAALGELERLAPRAKDPFPIETTTRQFRRYLSWWTTDNGFFGDADDLAGDAADALPDDWKL